MEKYINVGIFTRKTNSDGQDPVGRGGVKGYEADIHIYIHM